MNMNTTNLVRMSGQFWKMTLEGNDIVLKSTISGLKAILSFQSFTAAIVRGTIQVEGGI